MIGVHLPLPGLTLPAHRGLVAEIADGGYHSVWANETAHLDAVTPLAAAAAWAPSLRIGTAIIPVQTRGPALLAMTAAALADIGAAGATLGIGASSRTVAQDWNARPYTRPLEQVRDTLRFLRAAFSGDPVSMSYDTFAVRNFRLQRPVGDPPALLVAALRPKMLQMASEEADGAIATMISPADLPQLRDSLGPEKHLTVWVTICPTDDTDTVYRRSGPALGSYLCLPAYRAQQTWLGRSDLLAETWAAWDGGDRKAALRHVPTRVIDELVIHGTAHDCRARITEYRQQGADEVILCFDPPVGDPTAAIRSVAPSSAAGR